MKTILQDTNTYILTCSRGEELMSELKAFAQKEGITAATFTVIGAADEVELAWYDVHAKEYTTKIFTEELEITGIIGNIGRLKDEIVVHNHGVFGRKDMSSISGHVNRAVISAACEIQLQKLTGTINRAYDEDTGLNLMSNE